MASPLVQEAFAAKPELLQAVAVLSNSVPESQAILEEVARYIKELQTNIQSVSTLPQTTILPIGGAASQQSAISSSAAVTVPDTDGPAAKKRRLNAPLSTSNGVSSTPSDFLTAPWEAPTLDVSFSVPARKKLSLQVSADPAQGIRALQPSSKQAEFGIPWNSVEHVLRLPVPEKATAAHNFCVFPRGGDGFSAEDAVVGGYETMVWAASDARKKVPVGDEGQQQPPTESELVRQVLAIAKAKVVEPSEKEFVSQARNPMRKEEKQYHVKAFRGSKEGYLFFLPTGIAFVFKKPLLFFSLSAIQAISYTSVLQRTFNLVISALPSRPPSKATTTNNNNEEEETPIEFEFSMLDQADFAGIDAYVKRHQLHDASMAAARKAKRYNVNKERGAGNAAAAEGGEAGEGAGAEGDGEGEESELRKAEREAEQIADDDEDDEEDDENFDPGSEGESEGEGDSTDEEDGEGGGGSGAGGGDGDDDDGAVDDED